MIKKISACINIAKSIAAVGFINSICSDTFGNIYAGGYFLNHSLHQYVAKWNGNNWNELGGSNALAANGAINSIYINKSDNIYAAGVFTNGSRRYVARYDLAVGIV